ncbi:ribonuclease H1 [Xylaria sp. CBS 124048]|nr:ribonuclease H1 [Xylaria sp. CBS 124048]
MVYIMKFHVGGACYSNEDYAIGAATCELAVRSGKFTLMQVAGLGQWVKPSKQRADLVAIIMALRWALQRYNELNTAPITSVCIYTGSRYAVNCVNKWIVKWKANNWVNRHGEEVANRDLIEEAALLESKLRQFGSVTYVYAPLNKGHNVRHYAKRGVSDLIELRNQYLADNA